MNILLSLLVALIGLLIYAFSTNPKFGWVGQQMFWCGLLVTLLKFQASTFTLAGLGR